MMDWRINNLYKINNAHLELVLDDKGNRNKNANECDTTMMQFIYTQSNTLEEITAKFDKYQLALWVKSNELYLEKRIKQISTRYDPRDIILVDLGYNVNGELSYEHPCVIIKSNYDKVFVVPCSSSKLKRIYNKSDGKMYPEYLKGTSVDGFTYSTALLIDNAKWISKSRIIKKYQRRITPDFFNILYNKVFGYVFEPKQYQMTKQQVIINELQDKIKKLEIEVKRLEQENTDLIQEKLDSAPKLIETNIG